MGASSWFCFCIAEAEESPCTEHDRVAELETVGAEGASISERTEYIAKTEESPSTIVDAVAELEAMTMVGASTSGRTEYYSKRCEAMMRRRGQFSDDVALEIEFSKTHWTEVSRLYVAPQSTEEEELNVHNRALFQYWSDVYPDLFSRTLGRYFILGRMIAKGGQGEIYEVEGHPRHLMKVFERGTSLQDLRQSGMLEDGRFAFLMQRCWGDLRKLIDQAMEEKYVDGIQGPPFPYNEWKEVHGWKLHPIDFMLGIARSMLKLHEIGISHRDLKASNIFLRPYFSESYGFDNFIYNLIIVADFECSIGVLGTGFWRAPEILSAPGNQKTITNEQWKKADVYSYGMTCFEIVTGRIPFDGELKNTKIDRQLIIEGKRPQLPSDLDAEVKDLISKCWEPNPSLRPTFFEIVHVVETISTNQCQFRWFGIGDELPPQYRLATVQEVDEDKFTVARAMPRRGLASLANVLFESGDELPPQYRLATVQEVHEDKYTATEAMIANLANGSIDGNRYGITTRLVKESDADYKLARLLH